MYWQLGNIVFEGLIGFDGLTDKLAISWAKQELMGTVTRVSPTGRDPIKLSATIRLSHLFCDPEAEIAALNSAALSYEVMPLINGAGVKVADFVIENLDKDIKHAFDNGKIRFADLNIDLLEYHITSKEELDKERDTANAKALSQNNPNTVRGVLAGYVSPSGEIASALNESVVAANETDKRAKEAQSLPERIAANSVKIAKYMQQISEMMGVIQSVLAGNPPLTIIAPYLSDQTNILLNTAANMKSAMPITDINAVLALNTNLQAAIENLKLYTAPLVLSNLTRTP